MALLEKVKDYFSSGTPDESSDQPVSKIPYAPIRQIIDVDRRSELLRLESYLRGSQHDHKKYDWNGRMIFGSGTDALDFPVDGYVPYKRRRPCVSLRLGKVIPKRFTTMVFGHDRFPTLCVQGDPEAEDYIRELAKESKLKVKMEEARNKGGACGSVIFSWGFDDGKPVIDVHSPGFIDVLKWADYKKKIPSVVLKATDFQKRVWKDDGSYEVKHFWRVRYWDDQIEQEWSEIPNEVAQTKIWQSWSSVIIRHNLGIVPIVWVQNIHDSEDVDGIADAEGQHEDFDEIDRLASATETGTVRNVDPTTVIHDRKGKDEGIVHKGSGAVIYSPGGASYLELQGTAITAAELLLKSLKQDQLDEAEVVLLDPEKLSGAGVSAASLKVRFAPMLAKCDLLRESYGDAIINVLKAMLETVRRLSDSPEMDELGNQFWSRVVLDPRVEAASNEDGDKVKTKLIERTPGTSSQISLKWPPYFPANWEDRRIGVETATKATGGQQVISRKTAVESLASMFDIESADDEIDRIDEDRDSQEERAKGLLDLGALSGPEKPEGVTDQDEGEEI